MAVVGQRTDKAPTSSGGEQPLRSPVPEVPSRHNYSRVTLARREAKAAYAFLSFNVTGFVLFTLIPVVFSLYLSFFNWPQTSELATTGVTTGKKKTTRRKPLPFIVLLRGPSSNANPSEMTRFSGT